MKYDQAKGRAVQKKGQTGRKIFINRDADYDTALRRIREALYGETINESMQLVRSLLFQGVTFRARTVLGGVLITKDVLESCYIALQCHLLSLTVMQDLRLPQSGPFS